jgi:hypothetical protein
MDDAVARFRAASEANNVSALVEALTPDVELVSPISGHLVFRGREDVRLLTTAVYASMTAVRWGVEIGDGAVRVIMGSADVGPLRIEDAMVLELAADGRIRRIRPHLRPWLALTLLAVRLGPKLARRPALVRRAMVRPGTRGEDRSA